MPANIWACLYSSQSWGPAYQQKDAVQHHHEGEIALAPHAGRQGEQRPDNDQKQERRDDSNPDLASSLCYCLSTLVTEWILVEARVLQQHNKL